MIHATGENLGIGGDRAFSALPTISCTFLRRRRISSQSIGIAKLCERVGDDSLAATPKEHGTRVESGNTAGAGLVARRREDGSHVRGGDPSSGLIALPERPAT
jgi:hypothetical protein